jgi:CRP-like cAMP-binding protein
MVGSPLFVPAEVVRVQTCLGLSASLKDRRMPGALDLLVRKLDSIARSSEAERTAVQNLPITVKHIQADQDIVHEGDQPSSCCILVEGFLFLYKTLPHGARQILSFHVPGDIADLQSLHLPVLDHGLAAATDSTVAFISHAPLRELCHAHPPLADKFWRATLVDGSIFREWVTNVGQREAPSRIAHILCEMFLKLEAVGLTKGNSFEFPITQNEIGEATGLSTVHVNRSIQKLRGEGLIAWDKGRCTIWDWERLQHMAMFDPTYLHLADAREQK